MVSAFGLRVTVTIARQGAYELRQMVKVVKGVRLQGGGGLRKDSWKEQTTRNEAGKAGCGGRA